MANLKMSVEAALTKLDERLKSDIEHLKGEAACLRRELTTAAEQLPELPAAASDLLSSVEVALAQEIQIGDPERKRDYTVVVRVDIPEAAYGTVQMSSYDVRVPTGKYRALFFLVPIKD